MSRLRIFGFQIGEEDLSGESRTADDDFRGRIANLECRIVNLHSLPRSTNPQSEISSRDPQIRNPNPKSFQPASLKQPDIR